MKIFPHSVGRRMTLTADVFNHCSLSSQKVCKIMPAFSFPFEIFLKRQATLCNRSANCKRRSLNRVLVSEWPRLQLPSIAHAKPQWKNMRHLTKKRQSW
jgi:hypothetical protein